ncbi:MAG: nucleotide exchange factor GrpE [Spirochaetaceae bacterium]|nr:MAG: nucleotide exchange factor GrpE [Spirochaetaceae bacterium]
MSNRKTAGDSREAESTGSEETQAAPLTAAADAHQSEQPTAAEQANGVDQGADAVAAEDGASSNAAVVALTERIAELEAENSELKDQYLRKQAEFENFRKRMNRDKEDGIAFANKQLLLDLVAIIDDFERAILSAEESRDFDSFHNGVALIEKQFTGMLERKWGLKRFDSVGEPFDPQRHEALTTEEVADHDESTVLEDYQKGYLLHDKVLRSAKVKVSVSGTR